MKKVRQTMRRLMALGIAVMLMAGSVSQTAYAAETGDEPDAAVLSASAPESTEGASEDIEVIDDSDEEASIDAPDREEGKEPSEESKDPEEKPDDPEETGQEPEDKEDPEDIDNPESAEDSSAEASSTDEEPGEEASLEDSEESVTEEVISEENKALVGAINPDATKHFAGPGIAYFADADSEYSGSWAGSFVYYGKYEGTPVRYRVLNKATVQRVPDRNKPLTWLDCDSVLFNSEFYLSGNNSWNSSNLKKWINGEKFLDKEGVFTPQEKAILRSPAPTEAGYYTKGDALAGDEKVFLLSEAEAEWYEHGYGKYWACRSKHDLNDASARWWTRSFETEHNQPLCVQINGEITNVTGYYSRGVSPTFLIDPAKIVYASIIKSSDYKAKTGNIREEYTLAIVDDGLSIEPTERPTYLQGELTIPCKVTDNSDASDPDYIMVICTNNDTVWTENGWSYGDISIVSNAEHETVCNILSKYKVDYNEVKETGKITIPHALVDFDSCYIFAVEENGAYETDYTSTPVKVTGFYSSHDDVSLSRYLGPGSNTIDIASSIEAGGKASVARVEDADGILSGTPTISSDGKLRVAIKDGNTFGKSANIEVLVGEAKDYAPYTINIQVTVADKTIAGLGTGIISNPNPPANDESHWSGSYVYYGKYNEEDVRYRVLDRRTNKFSSQSDSNRNTMLMDCDIALYEGDFANLGASNPCEWEFSDVRRQLNGDALLTKEGSFTAIERETIAESTVDESMYTPLYNDKIFLLDVKDVNNEAYGYGGAGYSASRSKEGISFRTGAGWLLRTASDDQSGIYRVRRETTSSDRFGVAYYRVDTGYSYVSPAFNVDLSSVVLSSLNRYSASSGGAGETGAEYTLALKDSGLGIKATGASKIDKNGNVSISYSVTDNSSLSTPDSIVAVVTNGVWTGEGWSEGAELLQSKKAALSGTKGTLKFKLDSSITGDYNIYILAMDESHPYETDYASAPVAVTMTAEVRGYEGIYDGEAHGITVDVLKPESGATVKYGTTEGKYDLTSSPAITDVSDSPFTVYYQITASGYSTKTGSATVVIDKADPLLTAPTARTGLTYDGSELVLVNKGYAEGGTLCYAVVDKGKAQPDESAFTETLPKAVNAGDYDVWYMVKGGDNYNDTALAKVGVSIAKSEFHGTKHVYATVSSNTLTFAAFCRLPELPDGAEYPDASKCTFVSGTEGFISISSIQVADGTISFIPDDGSTVLLFNAGSKSAGTTATYKIPVTGADSYADYDVLVTITASDKENAKASITGGDRTVQYGDAGFTLTGDAEKSGENGVWTWESSDTSVAEVGSNSGAVTIKKAGTTYIKATYTSDSTTGSAEICLTVKKKVLGVAWSDTSFIFDGTPHKPTAVLSGVPDDLECTVTVSGEQTNAGKGYIATATLTKSSAFCEIDAEQATCAFSIAPTELTENMVTLSGALTYTGSRQAQSVLVRYGDSDVTDQCTVTGNKETNAGTYTLTVSGMAGGSLSGSVTKEFTIAKKETMPKVAVTGLYIYTGSPIEPEYTVKDPDTGMILSDRDYHVEFADNINAGKGKIIISEAEDGNYIFDWTWIQKEFNIGRAYWVGEKDFSVSRSYVYNEESGDGIDISEYLPEDIGQITLDDPVVAGSVQYAEGKEPKISGNILYYTLAPGDKAGSGTVTVKAHGQNYSNDFTVSVTLCQKAMGLVEKNKTATVRRVSREITVGKSFTLTPEFLEEGVTNTRVVWSSSNPDVASVGQNGKVKALSAGYATITAVSEYEPENVFTQCSVTVTDPVTSIALDRKSYTFGVGESVTIEAGVLPFTAVQKLKWTANNGNVSVETSEDGLRATVTGVNAGKAVVTAAATDDSGRKAACSFTVGAAVPDFAVSGKGGATTLAAGKTLAMSVTWADNKKPANAGVTWKVVKASNGKEDPDLAVISSKGVLTGKGEGVVKVVATSTVNREKTFESPEITIYVPVKNVALNVTSATVSQVANANALQLGVKVTPTVAGKTATGPNLGSEPTVKWSRDPEYAENLSVDENTGIVTAGIKAAKNVPVIAKVSAYGGYSKTLTCKVTVTTANPLKGIKISKSKLSIGEGNAETLTASLDPVNPDGDMGYTWESSDESVVTVDANGKVVALKSGSATITVKANGTVTAKGKTVNPSASCVVTVIPSVKSIEFTNAKALVDKGLNKGKTYALKTKLTLSQGKGKAATGLEWTSSDESIATVSQKGVVKAVAPGTVIITATSKDEKASGSAPSVSVTFTAYSTVTKIAIDKTKMTIGTQKGSNYGKVSIATVLPKDVTDPSITWTVNGKNVSLAAVGKNASPSQGVFKAAGESVITERDQALALKGLLPGVVKLTGVTNDGSKKKVTCTVTVRGQVTGLKLKAKEANVKVGKAVTIAPIVDIAGIKGDTTVAAEKKSYAAYKKYTDVSVSYRSSNTAVATVANNGKVKIAKTAQPGDTATIFVATADGKYKAQFTVTVIK